MPRRQRSQREERAHARIRFLVGERVRAVRTALGYTTEEMARPRYSREYVTRVESYETLPTLTALWYFAENAGLTLEAFLFSKRYGRPLGAGIPKRHKKSK